jgi:hypothetical protein
VTASPDPPQLLGTTIKLTATAVDTNAGPLTYKWEVEYPASSTFVLMQDFDVATAFQWTPNFTEGTYHLRLTARDYLASTSAQLVVGFKVNPLVTGSQAVVVPTANPLVACSARPPVRLAAPCKPHFNRATEPFKASPTGEIVMRAA